MKSMFVFLLFSMISSGAMAEVIPVSNQQLQTMLQQQVPLVDLRTAPEWQQTGVIEGSHLITFFEADGSYDAPAFVKALDQISGKEKPVVLICRSGNRTSQVANYLSQKLGYAQVYHVEKGIREWIQAGLPTVKPTLAQ